MLQPADVDGITVAARDEVVDEVAMMHALKNDLQGRLGSTDQAVVDLQAAIDRLTAVCNDASKWQA